MHVYLVVTAILMYSNPSPISKIQIFLLVTTTSGRVTFTVHLRSERYVSKLQRSNDQDQIQKTTAVHSFQYETASTRFENENTLSLYVAAMIIDYRDCCMREPSFGCQWIMWYGDYQLSEVKIIERH